MDRVRRYVQSASNLYSIEPANFSLVCYSVLFGIAFAMLSRSAMECSLFGIVGAGVFALMSVAFLILESWGSSAQLQPLNTDTFPSVGHAGEARYNRVMHSHSGSAHFFSARAARAAGSPA